MGNIFGGWRGVKKLVAWNCSPELAAGLFCGFLVDRLRHDGRKRGVRCGLQLHQNCLRSVCSSSVTGAGGAHMPAAGSEHRQRKQKRTTGSRNPERISTEGDVRGCRTRARANRSQTHASAARDTEHSTRAQQTQAGRETRSWRCATTKARERPFLPVKLTTNDRCYASRSGPISGPQANPEIQRQRKAVSSTNSNDEGGEAQVRQSRGRLKYQLKAMYANMRIWLS